MKRRSFFQLLLAMAGIPLLPKVAAKPPEIIDDMGYGLSGYYPPIPAGTIQPYMGACPLGWLPCDGRWVSRNEFPKLWEAIGTPGKIPFQLPEMNPNVLDKYDQFTMCAHGHSIVDPGHDHGASLYSQMQYIIKT